MERAHAQDFIREHRLIYQQTMPRPEPPMPELVGPELAKPAEEPKPLVESSEKAVAAAKVRADTAENAIQKTQAKMERVAYATGYAMGSGVKAMINHFAAVQPSTSPELQSSTPTQASDKPVDQPAAPVPENGERQVPEPKQAAENPQDALQDAVEGMQPTPEQMQEGPKTHAELLTRQFDDAMKMLEKLDFTKGEALAAIMKVIAACVEFIKRAFDGTLNDALEKKDQAPAAGAEGAPAAAESAADTPRARVTEELQKRPDPKDVEGLKKEKQQERERNTEDIKEIDTEIDSQRDQNKKLLDQQNGLKKQIEDLRGRDDADTGLRKLETQLKKVTRQLKAGQEALDDLDKQRDELTARNKQLDEEIEAADVIGKDVEKADKVVNKSLKKALDILAKRFPEMSVPTLTVVIKPDGTVKVKISGMDNKDAEKIPGVKKEADGSMELDDVQATQAAEDITEQSKAEPPKTSEEAEAKATFDVDQAAPLEEQTPGFKKTRQAADAIRSTISSYGAEYMDPSVMDQLVTDLNTGYAEYISDHNGTAVPDYASRYANEITQKMQGLEGNTPKPRLIIDNKTNTFSVTFDAAFNATEASQEQAREPATEKPADVPEKSMQQPIKEIQDVIVRGAQLINPETAKKVLSALEQATKNEGIARIIRTLGSAETKDGAPIPEREIAKTVQDALIGVAEQAGVIKDDGEVDLVRVAGIAAAIAAVLPTSEKDAENQKKK